MFIHCNDSQEWKYQYVIKKQEKVRLKHLKDS